MTAGRRWAVVLALVSAAGLVRADALSDAYDALKQAERDDNAPAVEKWAGETSRLARAEAVRAKPENVAEDYWKDRVEYARETDIYTEYSLAVTAIKAGRAPQDVVSLVNALIAQNAKSTYLGMAVGTYLSALAATGGSAGQLDGAARIVELLPNNEDALFALAQGNLTQNQVEPAYDYATRLVAALATMPKPETLTEADWDAKKTLLTGRGHFLAGVASCQREMWTECDTNLREALPLIGDQAELAGPANLYLGMANYELASASKNRPQMEDAVRFTEQAAALEGPTQEQAKTNLKAMRRDLAKLK